MEARDIRLALPHHRRPIRNAQRATHEPDRYVLHDKPTRVDDAGIKTKIGGHTLRTTGIIEYLATAASWKWRNELRNRERAATSGLY